METMEKEEREFYEQTLKQFGGNEKKMMEHFNKVIEYQKKKKLIIDFVFDGQEPDEETMNEAFEIGNEFSKKLEMSN